MSGRVLVLAIAVLAAVIAGCASPVPTSPANGGKTADDTTLPPVLLDFTIPLAFKELRGPEQDAVVDGTNCAILDNVTAIEGGAVWANWSSPESGASHVAFRIQQDLNDTLHRDDVQSPFTETITPLQNPGGKRLVLAFNSQDAFSYVSTAGDFHLVLAVKGGANVEKGGGQCSAA